jgi:hypothetical protein
MEKINRSRCERQSYFKQCIHDKEVRIHQVNEVEERKGMSEEGDEARESRCGKKNRLHEEKGVREEKATERREMGCEKNMEMKEEETDLIRRWKKRKRSGCEHQTFLSKGIN